MIRNQIADWCAAIAENLNPSRCVNPLAATNFSAPMRKAFG
jgi:hypothetical protein